MPSSSEISVGSNKVSPNPFYRTQSPSAKQTTTELVKFPEDFSSSNHDDFSFNFDQIDRPKIIEEERARLEAFVSNVSKKHQESNDDIWGNNYDLLCLEDSTASSQVSSPSNQMVLFSSNNLTNVNRTYNNQSGTNGLFLSILLGFEFIFIMLYYTVSIYDGELIISILVVYGCVV